MQLLFRRLSSEQLVRTLEEQGVWSLLETSSTFLQGAGLLARWASGLPVPGSGTSSTGQRPSSPPGPLALSPLQVLHAEHGGLQAAAVRAGAQGHGLGCPQLSHQQHGGLRGSEAQGAEGWVGWGGGWGVPPQLLSGARAQALRGI